MVPVTVPARGPNPLAVSAVRTPSAEAVRGAAARVAAAASTTNVTNAFNDVLQKSALQWGLSRRACGVFDGRTRSDEVICFAVSPIAVPVARTPALEPLTASCEP